MSLEDDNKAFVRRYFDHLNKDPLGTDECFATDYRYHNSSMPHVKDLATLKEFNTAAFNALADVRFTLEDMVATREIRWFTEPPLQELIRLSSWGSLGPISVSLSRQS